MKKTKKDEDLKKDLNTNAQESEVEKKEHQDKAKKGKKKGKEKQDNSVSIEEFEKIQQQKDETKDQLLRLAAEFDNYKKRAKKDLDDIRRYGNEDIVKSLIPVMDDIQRFFGSVSEEDLEDEKVSKIFNGVKMILQTLEKNLKDNGLEKHSSLGQPFDPYYSDAVMQQESPENENGTVINEFEPAYVLNGRVVRHGKVIVAKNES